MRSASLSGSIPVRLVEAFVFRKATTTFAEVWGATFLTPTTFSMILMSLSVNLAGSAGFRLIWPEPGPPNWALPGITRTMSRSSVENCDDTPE
ncbi:Uncharacterised protein [uncultured archaeon]|nr:Uncharacterised protein [uncultured archaeon]